MEAETGGPPWRFAVDVGGTFTDCLCSPPDRESFEFKILSSASFPGHARCEWVAGSGEPNRFRLTGENSAVASVFARTGTGFWNGYQCLVFNAQGTPVGEGCVVGDHVGSIDVSGTLATECFGNQPFRFELVAGQPAPVVAIRHALGLQLAAALPRLQLDLGTTRGTNALLTRNGARVGLVTTQGFADILEIGDQARPDLFARNIVKRHQLQEAAVGLAERISADGAVLEPLDTRQTLEQLRRLASQGISSLAICLLNAYSNPQHELQVAELASQVGFGHISLSHQVANSIKLVPRAETTVLDAYLNPVLREYVDCISSYLPAGSRMRMMTSTGGLVDREHFSGKDSVLSGPAGGVVGFSRVAEQLGFNKSIGFDMGGTSTDVARCAGELERQYETEKAGVRIVHPMLAIETVAAGGGSVCQVEQGRMTVGPQSAGADPGPACYGRGGPLTVTDLNLVLGRIQPEQFPFALDPSAALRRLEEARQHLVQAGVWPAGECGDSALLRLAAGFLEIAVHHMTQAIHKISVARGFDSREYLLVAFGGAAPQVACDVARQLGMNSILVHPWGPVLSAAGISFAHCTVHASQSYELTEGCVERDPDVLQQWVADWAALRQRALDDLWGQEPDSRSAWQTCLRCDMRTQGTEGSLTIDVPADCIDAIDLPAGGPRDLLWNRLVARYHDRHQHLFGFVSDKPVELVELRVEASQLPRELAKCPLPEPLTSDSFVQSSHANPAGRWPRYEHGEMKPGDVVAGPALVVDTNTSTFVAEGWRAVKIVEGQLLLSRHDEQHAETAADSKRRKELAPPVASADTAEPDPVLQEIIHSSLFVIAEQMGLVLQRTSTSVNVKERLDFSCAIFNSEGDLVVNAPHIPVHLGAMGETVRSVIRHFGRFTPGDVLITNDPYQGGSHLPDVTVVTPVFVAADGPEYFVASRCHHAEIGGLTPGSMPPQAKVLGEEGVLISNFKLVAGGKPRFDELEAMLRGARYPSRAVADNLADVRAQIAANQLGVLQLLELDRQYGTATLRRYLELCLSAANTELQMALQTLDGWQSVFSDSLDCGARIQLETRVKDQKLSLDFSGTSPVLENNLNANRGIVVAAVMYAIRLLINKPLTLNAGLLRSVELVLPTCFLNPNAAEDPFFSPACVGGNVETSQRIVDVLLGSLSLAAASQGTMNNLLVGDESFGFYETICGGAGATASGAGADAVHTHMTNTRATDPEILERRFPMRLIQFAIRADSGGAGRLPGGRGVVREFEFCKPLQVSILSNRRGNHRPYGMEGGGPGQAGRNLLLKSGEPDPLELGNQVEISVEPGDRLRIETPGGGGWGSQ